MDVWTTGRYSEPLIHRADTMEDRGGRGEGQMRVGALACGLLVCIAAGAGAAQDPCPIPDDVMRMVKARLSCDVMPPTDDPAMYSDWMREVECAQNDELATVLSRKYANDPAILDALRGKYVKVVRRVPVITAEP